LPIQVNNAILTDTFKKAREKDSKVLVVVTGTKSDFYKQAPLVSDAVQVTGIKSGNNLEVLKDCHC
jgi:hypothetical protein